MLLDAAQMEITAKSMLKVSGQPIKLN
jgi:hypothetical protein